MDYTEILQNWLKGELLQGKIMIGIGVLIGIVFIGIFRSQNELLRGMLIPLGILIILLLGYGGYILQSRPAHVQQSIALYQSDKNNAVKQEITKHTNDNKAGKTLTKYVYPSLIIVAAIALFLFTSRYYRGMAIGFILLFASTFIIDSGFVNRSDKVIQELTINQ